MIRLLAVDDEPLNRLVICESLSDDGYTIDEAEDGEAAWALMQENTYDLIILDRMMPRLDGLSLLKRAKADPRWAKTPVIMQTAATTQEQVREGIEAGAYYYLTKPYDPESLQLLVSSVVADIREQEQLRETGNQLQLSLSLLDSGRFAFRTLAQAQALSVALSRLCDQADSICMGLSELLVNAVEHGNLSISYDEKTRLRQDYQWEEEVERRLGLAPWNKRLAHVSVCRVQDELSFTIEDEGEGFDWARYLDFDPERAFDPNGRGIAMAHKLGFLSLTYQGKGNVVVAKAKGVASPAQEASGA